MASKQDYELWILAEEEYAAGSLDRALRAFEAAGRFAKVSFNIGMIHSRLNRLELAIDSYAHSTELDEYLAVSYFQKGYAHFMITEYNDAVSCFSACLEVSHIPFGL
jgi:tetratricopeptide (TPR) repeat protein